MEKSKKGIVCILLSAFCFSLMSLFIRLAGDVPTMQKCFFRNLVAMLIAIAALVKAHQPFRIGKGNLKYLLCRAIGGTCGLICNFYAVDHISISDASMLNKLSPFFAIICSFFVLKEVAGKLDWVTVIGSIRRNAACCEADDEHGDSAGSDRGTRRIWRRFCVYVCQKAWTTRRK